MGIKNGTRTIAKILSVIANLAAAGYCGWSVVKGDVPSPKNQWYILFCYLPIICLVAAVAELGYTTSDFMQKYVRFLNHRIGRSFLYILYVFYLFIFVVLLVDILL